MANVKRLLACLSLALLLMANLPVSALADEASPDEEPLEAAAVDEAEPLDANSSGNVNVYRLYNRKTSEHLYTTSKKEYDTLPTSSRGQWAQEGVAWVAPKKSSAPVYRLYNRGLGDHHYTTSKGERDALTRKGWRYEGVAFYSDDSRRVPLYRVYNGRLRAGQHHYTTSAGERDSLVRNSGWRNEGVGFYAVKKGSPGSNKAITNAFVGLYRLTDGQWAYEGYENLIFFVRIYANGRCSIIDIRAAGRPTYKGYWIPSPDGGYAIVLYMDNGRTYTFTDHSELNDVGPGFNALLRQTNPNTGACAMFWRDSRDPNTNPF